MRQGYGAAFLEVLRARLILVRESLSEDGYLLLHCDYKKRHYVRAMLLALIFPDTGAEPLPIAKVREGRK